MFGKNFYSIFFATFPSLLEAKFSYFAGGKLNVAIYSTV